MIRALRIARFGRFVDCAFALGPVTAFIGPNESGKSTLFDALFEAICRPPGTIKRAKDLRRRYGDHETPEIEWQGEPPQIEADEYLNLLAIPSSGFDLELDDKSEWLQRVKSALFSGGIDPNRLVKELNDEAAESGRSKAARQIRDGQAERDRLEGALADLGTQREAVMARQRHVEEAAARLRQLEQQAAAAQARLGDVETHLGQQRLIRERERHGRALAELQRAASAGAEIDAAAAAADEAPLTALHQRLETARSRVAAAEAGERQAREERERAAAAGQAAERELAEAGKVAALAADLRRASERRRASALPGLIAAAALGLAAALAPSLPAWARIGLAAAAAAAGALALLLAALAVRRRIESLRGEWRRRGGPGELPGSRWEDLLAELLVREGAAARLRGPVESAAAGSAAREAALAAAAAEAAGARDELAAAGAEEERWLREHGAASVDDYRARRARRLAAERVLADAQRLVAQARAAYAAPDDDALRAELDRRLRDLDAAILESPLAEPDVRSLENERAELQQRQGRLSRERETVKESVDQERGSIRSSLAELPQRILACEKSLGACKAELARMERTRKAAAIARDLFAEIARDSDVLMEQLGSEIASAYGDLMGGPRDVRLATFDVARARAVDAGGEQRDLDALSSGTRDLFLLAARLTLAARSRPDRALIVLDEPFHAIDDDRAARALALLKRFQQDRGWQIVLFSKDEGMAGKLRALFPDVEIHRLSRAQQGRV